MRHIPEEIFYQILSLYRELQFELIFKIGADLLEGVWSYGGLNLGVHFS